MYVYNILNHFIYYNLEYLQFPYIFNISCYENKKYTIQYTICIEYKIISKNAGFLE